MKLKLLRTGIIAAFACVLLSVSAMAASRGVGTVDASALNLRKEASLSSSVITTAPRGAIVIISDGADIDGWYKVWYKGYVGYMSDDYLSLSDTATYSFGSGTVNATSVRLRSGPGTESSVIGVCDKGDSLTVTGVSGTWYKISLDGTEGYIRSDYVSLYSASSSSSSSSEGGTTSGSTAGATIVETAEKYLGVPYVWAGTSPSGFDCSGFVYYVFKECGYSTNRTAASLYSNGEYVEKSELQPGDIICFTSGSYSYIGHVGIYIGDGKFIHASSGSGKVIISSLSETYYSNHYYGARRIAA